MAWILRSDFPPTYPRPKSEGEWTKAFLVYSHLTPALLLEQQNARFTCLYKLPESFYDVTSRVFRMLLYLYQVYGYFVS